MRSMVSFSYFMSGSMAAISVDDLAHGKIITAVSFAVVSICIFALADMLYMSTEKK